jgi:hypothetical protein
VEIYWNLLFSIVIKGSCFPCSIILNKNINTSWAFLNINMK